MSIQPKNQKIKISDLGVQNTFVSGNKNWRIDWAEYEGNKFEKGVTVKWIDENNRVYKGKIEWLIIIDDGSVEIATDMPLGRLSLDEVIFVKK